MAAVADLSRPTLEALQAPYHIGTVTLRVNDLAGLTAFYRDSIGLQVIAETAEATDLGVDGAVLVRLERGATRPASAAGLFHLALLLPSRAELADWLAHAATIRLPLEGASDHLVSEAIYLSDPEGNGIEIYRDRPRADWPRRGGAIQMATQRLDLQALLAERKLELRFVKRHELEATLREVGSRTAVVMLTQEHHASPGFSRLESDGDFTPGMNPDPCQRERRCDRGLKSEQSDCHSDSLNLKRRGGGS
mgnify:CR=1 FL=1